MTDYVNSSLSAADDNTLYNECKKIDNLTVSTDSVALIEKFTKEQARCLLWHEHRTGRITASKFHSASTTSSIKPARSLIKDILTSSYDCSNKVPSIAWGVEHEADARNMYAEIYSATHSGHTVSAAGLVVCKNNPFLAASPDGWVTDTCCGKGILEIKCPFSLKDEMPDSAAYLTRDADGALALRKSHQYYKQVQGQLNICDVEYCDFIVWTAKGFAVACVSRDKDCFDKMLPKRKAFFTCAILPQIITGAERVILPVSPSTVNT
jgi:putative phage-type endonuclease